MILRAKPIKSLVQLTTSVLTVQDRKLDVEKSGLDSEAARIKLYYGYPEYSEAAAAPASLGSVWFPQLHTHRHTQTLKASAIIHAVELEVVISRGYSSGGGFLQHHRYSGWGYK